MTSTAKQAAAVAAFPDAASAAATNSNVHETFELMSTLIYPRIPVEYLDRCAKILQRRHLETVVEERAVQRLCALPTCGERLAGCVYKFLVVMAWFAAFLECLHLLCTILIIIL